MATKALRNKKCLYCERKFGKAEHLKRHQRAHTGEKPFKCAHCGREYARSDVLMRHVRNHHSTAEKQTVAASPVVSSQTHGDGLVVEGHAGQSPQLRRSGGPASSIQAQCSNSDHLASTTDSQRQSTGNPADQSNLEASQRAKPLLGPENLGDRRAAAPLEGFEDWLGPQDLPLAANMWDDLSHFDFMSFTNDARLSLSPYRPRQTLHSPPKDNISDERYAKIASLWPTKKQTPRRLIQTLWRDVASFREENIFSQSLTTGLDESAPPETAPGEATDSRWGLDEERRARLIEDCAPLSTSFWPKANRGGEPSIRSSASDALSQDSSTPAKFPSTQILDISLDVFFRRFHHLMPFIHEPTFSAKKTSSTLLFPMCLMGLTMLDSVRAKRFVRSHLGDAIERCRRDLVVSSQRGGQLGDFLTTVAAAVLLLSLAAINPKQPPSEHSRLLYNETINAAQRQGLFTPQEGEELSSALFQSLDNGAMWRAWTRIESVKRLILCLIMSDGFFSALDDHNPIIRTEQLHFYFPCKTELFQAATERRWSLMVNAGSLTIMPLMIPQLASAILPPASDASAIGFFGLFSTVWVRIVEARHRYSLLASEHSNLPIPADIFAHDEHAASIAPFLMKMWTSYGDTMCTINPNCEAFWHHLNINMTADLGVFEIASGREGAESAKNALDDIATWSQTAAARRACLHAAHTFSCMSKRRPIDGTSYEAEIALVHAALVLGLYVFVMPQPDETDNQEQQAQRPPEAFELLDQVDWNLVGETGFTSYGTTSADIDMGIDPTMCAAKGFIQNGGPISFSGVVQNGGYASARRVLLDYVYLLEDVGTRYNVMEFCHILRILSDALIDFDSGGAE
ncbi:Zinc-finger double domain-containing protein [Cladophialophora immunda]|nr:Zinc-finger double domain-containing protein [Cladophialophora immunda]